MPKILNFNRFPDGLYFLNFDNTELKRSSKIFFSVSERHRWAVVGQCHGPYYFTQSIIATFCIVLFTDLKPENALSILFFIIKWLVSF